MSGGYSSSHSRPEARPEQVLAMYNQGLPQALGTTFGLAPAGAANLGLAAAESNPIYTASGQQQLQQFAPGYQQAGIDAQTRQAGASADLIGGEGGRTAINADFLNRAINPNYYNTANRLAQSSSDLLGSFGRGAQLGGGEMAAAERAINQGNQQTGNLGNNNAYNTVGNALNFGEYARQKQALLSGANGAVNQTVPNMVNPTFNPVSTALNAGNVSGNFGLSQYNPTQANSTLTAPIQFGQSLLSGAFGYGNTPVQESKNTNGGVSVGGSGGCCFIFLEAYHGTLPLSVRKCRDRYYRLYPTIATGYRRMARWLVPLMRHSETVNKLVWKLMVCPLTMHGEFVTRKDSTPHKSCRKFWFTVWSLLGKV